MPGARRTRLLFRRVGTTEHRKLKSYISPKDLDDPKFEEAVSFFCRLFDEQSGEFQICFKFLTFAWGFEYVTWINEDFKQSDFSSISNDRLDCLLFLCDMRDSCYADVRVRTLNMVKQNQEITLQHLNDEFWKIYAKFSGHKYIARFILTRSDNRKYIIIDFYYSK